MLNKSSSRPLYIQLYNILKEQIECGILKEGSKLPSENTLTEAYNVSRATVRKTLGELERCGFIYKEKGKGSFVSIHHFHQSLDSFYSFSNEIKKHGKNPKYKLLHFSKIIPSNHIKNIMKLNEDDAVYRFEIIRKIENEPILFETTYLPTKRFKNFEKENLNKYALYDILQKDYHVKFSNAEQTFYPILANNKIKKYFEIDVSKSMACMKVNRISYEKINIVEYTEAVVKGDKFRYKINFNI